MKIISKDLVFAEDGKIFRITSKNRRRYYEWAICPECGDKFLRRKDQIKFHLRCCRKCYGLQRSKIFRGKNHHAYKPEMFDRKNGIRLVHTNDDRKKIADYRLKVEEILGRRLKKMEVIHHINGNKLDGRNENLLICDRKYHRWIHDKMSFIYQNLMFDNTKSAKCY
jgi:hypothetical protein